MANFTFITEFGDGAKNTLGVPIAAAQDNGQIADGGQTFEQPVLTNSGSSQQSLPFKSGTRLIRITSDGVISYTIGHSPIVTIAMRRLAASSIEYVGVVPGQCVAIITNV